VLAFAVVRPFGWPEAVVAVPAAGLVLVTGAISLDHAGQEARQLGPVIGFLAAVLVLAQLCDEEGLFHFCGAWMALSAAGSPQRLLGQVFAVASVITAALSLDATVVLLTPVVLTTVRRLRAPVRPHAYATAHLANAASLLLPVSNLTNLLAFHVTNMSFTKFTAVMALPWLAAVGTVYLVFRVFFRRDRSAQLNPSEDEPAPPIPVFALAVVALTLAGFVIAEAAGVAPAWAALAGSAVMALRSLTRRHTTPVEIVRAVNIPFLVFVLALGVVVQAVMQNGVSGRMGAVLPSGSGLLALLGFAVVAAVLANIVNNLPATLVLVPLVAPSGPAAVLAVLIGVNIGPNLTYVGSLSNLLWRSVLRRYEVPASVGEYTRLGLCTVPTALVAAVLTLWVGVRLLGL
jgi:arsenical pump membrane protein